jgi:hypothetical protein
MVHVVASPRLGNSLRRIRNAFNHPSIPESLLLIVIAVGEQPLLSKTSKPRGWRADLTRAAEGLGADSSIVPSSVLSNIMRIPE